MKRFLLAAFLLISAINATSAPLPPKARAEVLAVLARLEASGCQFNRNGTWHRGAEAKAHLLRKLEYVEKNASIQSAENFIELAASTSSVSGKPYEVRCGDTAAVASGSWLREQLGIVRGSQASPGTK